MQRMMSANCSCEQRLYLSRNLWKLERGGGKEGGGAAGARGDTGRIVPLSDSPFSLISSRSSYRKPDRKKKSVAFYSWSLQFLFLAPPPPLSFWFLQNPPPLFLYYWLRYEAVMEISFLVPKYFPSVTIKPAYHDSAHICVIAQV